LHEENGGLDSSTLYRIANPIICFLETCSVLKAADFHWEDDQFFGNHKTSKNARFCFDTIVISSTDHKGRFVVHFIFN